MDGRIGDELLSKLRRPPSRAAILLAREHEPGSIRAGELLDRESRGPLRGAWLLFVPFLFYFLISFFCHLLLTLALILLASLVSHGWSPLMVPAIVSS
jgi:hypothetical protein